jgi:hypothetical protein
LGPYPEIPADQELGWFEIDPGLPMAVLIFATIADGIGVERR